MPVGSIGKPVESVLLKPLGFPRYSGEEEAEAGWSDVVKWDTLGPHSQIACAAGPIANRGQLVMREQQANSQTEWVSADTSRGIREDGKEYTYAGPA